MTLENKYLKEDITNSYKAEKAKINLAEFYALGKNPSKDIVFRNRILTNLHLPIAGNNLQKKPN